MTTTLDKRICPGCGRRCGVHSCRRCDFASNTPIPTTRELLDAGTDYRECSGVDLGAFARSLVRDVRAADIRDAIALVKDHDAMLAEIARLAAEFAAHGEDFVGLALALRPQAAEWMASRAVSASTSSIVDCDAVVSGCSYAAESGVVGVTFGDWTLVLGSAGR